MYISYIYHYVTQLLQYCFLFYLYNPKEINISLSYRQLFALPAFLLNYKKNGTIDHDGPAVWAGKCQIVFMQAGPLVSFFNCSGSSSFCSRRGSRFFVISFVVSMYRL